MVDTGAFNARVQENIRKHRRVLNRLESHLGCVTCRGPLTDGVCPVCDPEDERV